MTGFAGGAAHAPAHRRLQALGLVPGADVEVIRRAPLRDPVLYRVCDYRLCLRRAEAGLIEVEPASARA